MRNIRLSALYKEDHRNAKGYLVKHNWKKTGARGQHRNPSPERIHRSARAAYELASEEVLLALALLVRASFHLG
jgi:hypothetical protein